MEKITILLSAVRKDDKDMRIALFIALLVFVCLFSFLFQYGYDKFFFYWSSIYNDFGKYALGTIPCMPVSSYLIYIFTAFIAKFQSITLSVAAISVVSISDILLLSVIVCLYMKDRKHILENLQNSD